LSDNKDINGLGFNDVQKKVYLEMNRGLIAPFTLDEVRKVYIGDLRAPGRDGVHGGDLVKEVPQAVNTATIPEGWNNTTIVLIQKVDDPNKVSQF
jgi:hypothetical protein